MSAPETAIAPAPVEDVKPVETPVAEPAPPAEEPKTEEAAAPVTEAPAEEAKPEVSCRVLCLVRRVSDYGRLTLTCTLPGTCRPCC